jgi:hypothetical protein
MGASLSTSAQGPLAPPTNVRDLVVFVARETPHLYRLVGSQPVPYGAARFFNPKSIVADVKQNCFYVFDEPRLASEKVKLWRIAADGSARVLLEADTGRNGGPFGLHVELGLDDRDRPLIADGESGLWRVHPNGQLEQLLQGKDKPLFKITAAGSAPNGLLVATSYFHDVSQHSTGLIQVRHSQGGLYHVNFRTNPPSVECLVANQRPGGAESDTYWRRPTQVFVDAHGRTVLVDAGSEWTRKEASFPQERVTESIINGGVLVRHPDGRFEDLTFKTPDQGSGPMRRPMGAAQWSDNAYIVADPELYVEGLNGTGGLLLLGLDGSREARWPFGYKIKAVGVAILRGVGTPAQATQTRRIRLADLVGLRSAGRITRIESVSWERQPADGGGLLGPIGMGWDQQPRERAETKLRSIFEGARWAISADGAVQFSAKDIEPQTEETPLVMRGTVTVSEQFVSIQAGYRSKSMFDTQVGSLDVRLHSIEPGAVVMNVTTNLFTKTERLKGTFEQTLPLATP